MTSQALPEAAHYFESPASLQWDNCSASDSGTFSDSDGNISDADNNEISAEWTATVPLGDKTNSHAAAFTEDQDAFLGEVLGEKGCMKTFDSANSIFIACLQAMYELSVNAKEMQQEESRLLKEQINSERFAREQLSHKLEKEELSREKLLRELQLAQSKLILVDSTRSDVKLLHDGLEQATHKLQAAQQEIETGKFERAKLSRDLRTAQEEIIIAEEELGEKEEQVVTIQNLLVDVETAHNELEKSVESRFSILLDKLDSMQAKLQSKEGFVIECNKLRSEVNAQQSQVVAMQNGTQSREQKENKRIVAIQCRLENQEQRIASLDRDGRHHFKAYQSLKDFTDKATGKLPQIDILRTVVDAHIEGTQSQERNTVKIFKTLQTRIDDHDQVLRRIQKKSSSYATNDNVGRISNLLATKIDDCTIEIGQNSQRLRLDIDSRIASIDGVLKELTTNFESLSLASVPDLHERIDAANEYIHVVEGHVKAVDQKVQSEAQRVIHVGQHVGVVECQIGEIQSQHTELQEDQTKLRCIVEQQGSMLRHISSHVVPGTSLCSANSSQDDCIDSSSSPILTKPDAPALFLGSSWTVAEVGQNPNGDLFNARIVKPDGYQEVLDRLPDNIRLIFNIAGADGDPRPTINCLCANDENIWAGIPTEHRRLVGLVCLKYMASDAKLSDDRKHLKWIAETLSAEDWAEYEYLVIQQSLPALGGQARFQGQAAWEEGIPIAFKCYRTVDNKGHEPLAKTEYKLSKDVMEELETWLDAVRAWSELPGHGEKPTGYDDGWVLVALNYTE